jgi:hypothetical protein
MLELKTPYSFSGVPYITYEALDQYAEAVVKDAMPEALLAPTILDVEKFIEFYLNLQVEFKRLSYDRKILGMTAFSTGFIQAIDETSKQTVPILVRAGTVIIDPLLLEKRNFARCRFTFTHEGSHWLIHRRAFAKGNPFGGTGKYGNQYLAAKEGRVDYSRSQKERGDIGRIERQADFLASAILMPKPTLRMAFKGFFERFGEKPRAITRGKSESDNLFAVMLPEYIGKTFGVSKRAALIRLEKLDAIAGKPLRGRAAL